ncbi:MAG: FecR domain-containing protein [Opitutae bacterium]|nr:FecR domain-containing protein [Opitutae bacterium]
MKPVLHSGREKADVVEAQASQWAVRRSEGLTASEEQALATWLAEDGAHAAAFARMTGMAEALKRARGIGVGYAVVTQLSARQHRRRQRRLVAAAAAVVLFSAVGWWAKGSLWPAAQPALAVANAFEPIRRLTDGSMVELNTGAEIAVRYDKHVRRVELVRGEALFRVEKDPGRPFIVRAGEIEVRAVGTAFNVRIQSSAVEVLVTEGKVGVDDTKRNQSLLPQTPTAAAPVLEAGQRLVVAAPADAGAAPSVQIAPVAAAEIAQSLAWRQPRLEFDGVTLAQAAHEMNRENQLQIVVADPTLQALHVSGTFLRNDPRTFARLMAASLGLKVEARGDGELVLSKP